jgi:hypothetical protein
MAQHGTAKVDLAKIPLFDGIDSAAIGNVTIFAQRIEKVKLANFTLVCCRLPLQSWRVARNLHFGSAPPGLRCRQASNWW